jgi:hypothetical protein
MEVANELVYEEESEFLEEVDYEEEYEEEYVEEVEEVVDEYDEEMEESFMMEEEMIETEYDEETVYVSPVKAAQGRGSVTNNTNHSHDIAPVIPDLALAAAAAPPAAAAAAAGGGLAAMIAMASKERTNRVESGQARSIPAPPPPPASASAASAVEPPPPAGGMAAMIALAATKRNDRLEAGGEAKISGEAKAPPAPSMADLIAAKANARTDRLDAGGEIQVRVIPEEHKKVFVSIADEAAKIGQLTRLNEKFVEAIVPVREEVKDTWVPSGLRTDNQRSKFFMVVNEAAALGQLRMAKGPKVKEVINYEPTPEDDESSEEENIDKMVDEHGRRVERTGLLMDQFVRENARENRKKDWALDSTQDVQYTSIDEVCLPTNRPPTFVPKKKQLTQMELMEAIGSGVAAAAWDRRFRLGRPNAGLKVTRRCDCRYCVNPNPYQTHKYKKIMKEIVEEHKPLPAHPTPPKPASYTKGGKGEWKPPHKSEPPVQFQKPPDKVFQVPKPPTAPPKPLPQAVPSKILPKFVPPAPPSNITSAPPPPTMILKKDKPNMAPAPPAVSSSDDSDSSDSESGGKSKKKKKDGKKKKKTKRHRKRSTKKSGKKNEPQETQVYVCSCTIL